MRHMSIVLLFVLVQTIVTNSFFADKCHDYCGLNSSKCLSNGRCLCTFGWTGPNAAYITSGPREGMIVADFCMISCQYNILFQNPNCVTSRATINSPTTHPVVNEPAAARSCKKSCGKFESAGRCLHDEKCLCWWGWTGNNAMYVNDGPYKNRIVADDCMISCHYTHDYRNPKCIEDNQEDAAPTEDMNPQFNKPSMLSSPLTTTISAPDIINNAAPDGDTSTLTTKLPHSPSTPDFNSTASPQAACDPKCEKFGQGKCQSDGSCLCWWGWTGPNATYITTGNLTNRIKAKYCTEPCHYTHDYINASCASIPTPKTCDIPSNSTPKLPCLPRCGAGVFHGECLRNGRCLCWWGWTGPHSCFIDGGEYNNRIIADYCEEPCHYTHDYRNESCVKNETAKEQHPVTTDEYTTQELTTTEQPTAAEDQPTTTEDKPTTTRQPIENKDQPTTLGQPIETEDQPTTTGQPIETEDQPTTTGQPIETEDQPTTTGQPIETEDQPTTTGQTTAAEDQPTTTGQPIETEDQPTTTGQPIETEDQPTTLGQTTATEDQPTTTGQPIETEDQPTTLGQPIETEDQPTTTGQPIETEDQPTTKGQPIKTEDQPTTTRQPTATEDQLTTTEEQPITTGQPKTSEGQPTTTETVSTETTDVMEPTEHEALQSTEDMKPTEATELNEAREPTEATDLAGLTEPNEWKQPPEPTEPTDETDLAGLTEPKEWKQPPEPTEPTDETDLAGLTEPNEWKQPPEPTEPTDETDLAGLTEPNEWKQPPEPTEPTDETDLAGLTEPNEWKQPPEPTEPTDETELAGLTEPNEWKQPFKPTEATDLVEPTDNARLTVFTEFTEATELTEAIEPTEVQSTKSVEPSEPTEPLESEEPMNPKEPGEINDGSEESNKNAQDSSASKEQSPAVSSKKYSPISKLPIAMAAFGILVIIFAMIGLVTMVKHHGKCFKRHLGYRQLGDNSYFVNEREMSDKLSKVI